MSNTPEPSLEDLPSFAFVGLASFLDGEDVLQLRCTSVRVKGLVDDEADVIWTRFLCIDFRYHQAKEGGREALKVAPAHSGPSVFGTTGSQAVIEMPSAFDTWKQWKLASWRYSEGTSNFLLNAPYFLRAAGIWARLEQWLLLQGTLGSSIRSSLNQGLALLDLPWPDKVLVLSTVHATQALLSFYGGQTPTRRDPWNGLFGGFSAYHYVMCTFFRGGEWDRDEGVIEIGACPVSHSPTTIVVNPTNGFVEYNTEPRVKICRSDQEDAVLDWFHEYVTRLETGYYQPGCIYRQTVGPMNPANAILQFLD
ncbi:hypothetical protein MHU86_7346 [Fragilaria crotonensis]|nr:hypothetical protein MHU86_7346 [Fragilaria crotonensis]